MHQRLGLLIQLLYLAGEEVALIVYLRFKLLRNERLGFKLYSVALDEFKHIHLVAFKLLFD